MTLEEIKGKMTLGDNKVRLHPDDYLVLAKYAQLVEPPNCIIDIGSYMGGSAEIFRLFSKPEVEVYTIDQAEKTEKEFQARYPNIHFIIKCSGVVGREWEGPPVGLCFIDGGHDRAKADFDSWDRHIIPGGYLLFHDFHPAIQPCVKDALDVLNTRRYELLHFPDIRNIWDKYSKGQTLDETVIFQLKKL